MVRGDLAKNVFQVHDAAGTQSGHLRGVRQRALLGT